MRLAFSQYSGVVGPGSSTIPKQGVVVMTRVSLFSGSAVLRCQVCLCVICVPLLDAVIQCRARFRRGLSLLLLFRALVSNHLSERYHFVPAKEVFKAHLQWANVNMKVN